MPKSKKWLWAGITVAILNPIFSGLIVGLLYLSEPSLKRYGQIVLAVSVVWGAIVFVMIQNFQAQGILPTL